MPEEPTPTNKAPDLGIDHKMAILMALNDAEYALVGDHRGTIGSGDRLTLVRRNLIDALYLAPTRAECAKDVRHAPDAVLVSDENMIVLPSEAVGPVEILDMTVNPDSVAAAVIPQ